MHLFSPAFVSGDYIPVKYTAQGDNVNPPLTISKVLPGIKSLILTVTDPDAPGGIWTHWLVWNIPPKTTSIAENSLPYPAVQGINDFGDLGYGGPNPPSGTHRYYFDLYAVSRNPNLSPLTRLSQLQQAVSGCTIDTARLLGLFSHS